VCAFQISVENNQPRGKAKTMKIIGKTIMVSALELALATSAFAQINTNLQFTAATSTDEQTTAHRRITHQMQTVRSKFIWRLMVVPAVPPPGSECRR
jgi:hypothetical protein